LTNFVLGGTLNNIRYTNTPYAYPDNCDSMTMPSLSTDATFALASFIRACHDVSNLDDFRSEVHPRLQAVLPHAMFACGTVRMADLRIVESMNLTFPAAYMNGLITEEKHATCPGLRRWVETRSPVYLDADSSLLAPVERAWASKCVKFDIPNLAVHGVMNLNQEHACYFAFGGIACWTKREAFLLQVLVPHLHYALTHVEDFGHKRPKKILTQREQEVLKWICGGKSNSEMASILGISSWTVKIHVSNLLAKLNASTRGHAVAKAISFGLIEV
jgi:DNA-binding CsgD family transcriptional regulator